MFESGPGGDFLTYFGQRTHDVYRVDIGKARYLGKPLDELLSPAIEREGGVENLRHIPKQISCKVCRTVFSAEHCMVDGGEEIDVYLL